VIDSIQELTRKSRLVVVGQLHGVEEIVNMARDVNDVTRDDLHIFIAGQVYEFQVARTLKGDKFDAVSVVQPEAFIARNNATPVAKNEIDLARRSYSYVAPKGAVVYLLFLEPLMGFPQGKYYVGVAQPWRFSIDDACYVKPESTLANADNLFPRRHLASVIEQVLHPESEAIPTPSSTSVPCRNLTNVNPFISPIPTPANRQLSPLPTPTK
jgi:hypothetical protein